MPLVPEIALAGRPVQVAAPDPLALVSTLSQLESADAQRQLRHAQLAELERKRQQQLRAAAYFAGGQQFAGTPSAGSTAPPATGLLAGADPGPITEQGGYTSAGPVPPQPDAPAVPGPLGAQPVATPVVSTGSAASPQVRQPGSAPRYKSAEQMYQDLLIIAGPEIANETVKGITEIAKEARMSEKTQAEREKLKLESDLLQQNLGASLLNAAQDDQTYARVYAFLQKSGSPLAAILPTSYDAKVVEAVRQVGLSQKERLEADLARQKEAREASEVYTIPTADGIYVAPRFAEQPGQGLTRVGEGEAALAPIRENDKNVLKKYNDAAIVAKDVNGVLDEAQRLIQEGVYESSVVNDAAVNAYPKIVTPGYEPEKLARTKALRELGARLTLSNGSLGNGVSEGDRTTYQKATGDFQSPKSLDSMYESIKTMRTIANKASANANELNEYYRQNKKLPDYAQQAVPQRQDVRERPKTSARAPLFSNADIDRAYSSPLNTGPTKKTREQIRADAQQRGYRVE